MSKEKKCTGCKGEGGWQYETPEGAGAEMCPHCEGTGSEPNDNDDITFNLQPKSTLKATLIVHPKDGDVELFSDRSMNEADKLLGNKGIDDVEGVKKIGLFDRLDNTIGNHMEGYATDEDLLKIAYEVNHYLVKQPYNNTEELERLRKVNGELVDALEYIVNSNIRLNGILQGKQALANAKTKEG